VQEDAHLLSEPSSGFQDQPGDLVGMRDQRQVARLHFDGLGAGVSASAEPVIAIKVAQ
jgi:hypothetical protein